MDPPAPALPEQTQPLDPAREDVLRPRPHLPGDPSPFLHQTSGQGPHPLGVAEEVLLLEKDRLQVVALAVVRIGEDLDALRLESGPDVDDQRRRGIAGLGEDRPLGDVDGGQELGQLGGIARAVKRAKGSEAPVYIGDQTRGAAKVRTLKDQVALETRTRSLNPKWFEGMLKHGHEGVRQIDAHVANTMGWSATTGQVDPWVYQRLSETFVLDEEMRRRMAALNPQASARMANRLLEAFERNYWHPDEATLAALQAGADELEDTLESLTPGVAAE